MRVILPTKFNVLGSALGGLFLCGFVRYGVIPPDKHPTWTMAFVSVQRWLKEIDQGAYDKSWEDASRSLKGKFTEARWTANLQANRRSVGDCLSRVQVMQFHIPSRSLQNGAVSRDTVIGTYKTSFSKATTVETVVFQEESDGVWRASNYTILRQ